MNLYIYTKKYTKKFQQHDGTITKKIKNQLKFYYYLLLLHRWKYFSFIPFTKIFISLTP